MGVQGQRADGKWVGLIPETRLSSAPETRAGRLLALPAVETEFVRLRISWSGEQLPAFSVRQIALYPR